MRILIVTQTYSYGNGQASFTIHLAESMVQQGHQVMVITPSERMKSYSTCQNGVLVENTTRAWVDALEKLIEDAVLRTTIRENAYRGFQAHHTLRTRAADWWNVYCSLKQQEQLRPSEIKA